MPGDHPGPPHPRGADRRAQAAAQDQALHLRGSGELPGGRGPGRQQPQHLVIALVVGPTSQEKLVHRNNALFIIPALFLEEILFLVLLCLERKFKCITEN